MNTFDIHDFNEDFMTQFTKQVIPYYDLWSIMPLQNETKELLRGTSEEVEKFKEFMYKHSSEEYPVALKITIANGEKANPGIMMNTTRKYYKVKFDKYKGSSIEQPLVLNGFHPYVVQPEQFNPMGIGPRNPMGFGGFSLNDLQGIIDKNVSDATKSIRAEYAEEAAKREADSIKRIAELEMKMELYKLDLRAREVEAKEQRLYDELDELEARKAEGLGTVKEYTKTIAGGLLEFGKAALGLDGMGNLTKKSEKKPESSSSKSPKLSGSIREEPEEDGFTESGSKSRTASGVEPGGNEAFLQLLDVVKGLSDDQKMQLMDVLIPEDMEGFEEVNQNNENPKNTNTDETVSLENHD